MPNQQGDCVNLADFKGKKNVVVYFYPKALTPGCTTQACSLRDVQAELDACDTVVLGLSPDPQAKLQKFIEKHSLNFDLLSDEDHKVAESYGVWGLKKFMGKEFMGIRRTSFVINKAGLLVEVLDKFKTANHHDVLLEVLRSKI